MGLFRWKFMREMKLAAIQRLETGSSAAEVARPCDPYNTACVSRLLVFLSTRSVRRASGFVLVGNGDFCG
jgi:hypothetical protein